jgi:hypothetical protein
MRFALCSFVGQRLALKAQVKVPRTKDQGTRTKDKHLEPFTFNPQHFTFSLYFST